jgi:phage terminase large subunit-like protein
VAYQIYDAKNKAFHTHVDYYFPEGALSSHPNRELYTQWAKDGHLKLCKGEVIDYAQIVNDILAANEYISIMNIGYDAYKALTCVNLLRAAIGYDRAEKILRAVPQTYAHYTASVDSFQYGALTGKETLNNNPINVFCITNAVIDVDRMQNKKPVKRGGAFGGTADQTAKIDGLIVTLICHWLFNNWES